MPKGKLWTPEEIEIVKQHAGTLTYAEIAEFLPGRNMASVRDLCRKHKELARLPRGGYAKNPWSAEDTAYLLANHKTMSISQLCKVLGRERGSIWTKMRHLRIRRTHAEAMAERMVQWTPELIQELIDSVPLKMCCHTFARKHKIGDRRVTAKAHELGIHRKRGGGFDWSEGDIERLREMHAKGVEVRQIAKELGRTSSSVHKKLGNLGLRVARKPAQQRAPKATRQRAYTPKATKPRLKAVSAISRPLDICPIHRCPVSNWQEHKARLGCKAIPPYMQCLAFGERCA